MTFLRQTWTLTVKNLLIVFVRNWFSTTIRAFLAPIIFMFFISYAKNFFVPPSTFGVGSPTPVRSLTDGLNAAGGGRNTVAFVKNGYTGGQIEAVINNVSDIVRSAGKQVEIVDNDVDLLAVCRSSLRGVSACYGAASFHGSPSEGDSNVWNYTLRADGSFGTTIFVDKNNNDAEIYILPFQHAIDSAIASASDATLPSTVGEYPFTSETSHERERNIQKLFMNALINILAVAFFIGICGVTYQLTGNMAQEREMGMSQLIEAMTPNRQVWHTQAARLLSNHLAFDIVYLPGWVIMGAIVTRLTFPTTSYAVVIIYHILAGLSLTSFSILGGALFRKAQLSGITVTLVSIVLAIIAQVTGITSSAAVAVTSLLFPPMNYTFFIIFCAYWERQTLPTDLVKGAPENPWQLPGIVLWILLIVQIFAFPVIGALVERSLYGTASKSRKLVMDPDQPEAIQISSFSKHYPPNWWQRKVVSRFSKKPEVTVVAVNDLNMAASRGDIMVLLGANGSGKSTTLNAITGLNTITEGAINVDGTGGLGYCPQRNILWDELTVYEHVKIFNNLKRTGPKDTKDQTRDLVSACDLGKKFDAKSITLSGGQKRKLQLAMMFTGGSRVCCVDEVSSGLDPLSRRKIWDILLAERGLRTLLITTHFLDEADVLADQIVVLSKGNLKAEGSAVELKYRFGGGYRVYLQETVKFDQPQGLDGVTRVPTNDRIVYQVASSSEAARFVAMLEEQGIADYQVNGPTIEDVFLKLAEEIRDDLPHRQPLVQPEESVEHTEADHVKSGQTTYEASPIAREEGGLQISTGQGTGMLPQTWILFRKRLTILRRNSLPYWAAVLTPIITAGLVTLFLKNFTALSCDPGAGSSNPGSFTLAVASAFDLSLSIPVGPSSRVSAGALARLSGLNRSDFYVVNTLSDFESYIAGNFRTVRPGGFFLEEATPVFSYMGNWDVYYAVLTQNLFDSVLSGVPISTTYQSFAVPFAPGAGKTLQLILYFGLAMSTYPGFFALYPTVERLRKVRALHYSNGIRAAPLWIAYLAFDFLFVLLISALCITIFAGYSSVWYGPGYLFVVFFLYGFTSILLVYVVSLFVTSQLAAFAFAAGGQAVFFLLYYIIYLTIITYANAAAIDHSITVWNFAFALITPAGNLLRALLLTLNEFSLLCRGHHIAGYPGDIMVYGGPIVYLFGQAIVLATFLIWWDSGSKIGFLRRRAALPPDLEETSSKDKSVLTENARVEDSQDPLRVYHATKSFGRNIAVEDVTFGARHGEVFALLGPNGAGKSTTISLIRGDLRPSHHGGDVLVEGTSITKHRTSARRSLGVCPQFDAMDSMTVHEHLAFYAHVRGVPEVQHNIEAITTAVGLTPYVNRMASKLSGGNKRKLSLAIAMMGNPSVLLLDEPSSGMDAAAKRVMWKTLGAVSSGRALLITTHSMEEADALAQRAGIMAKRMLAVGTVEELRRNWGSGWYVHLVLRNATSVTVEEMESVGRWVEERIEGAKIEGRMLHGQIRFRVPSDVGVGRLFEVLETEGKERGVEYYSVGRATLDQVFLEIVGRHNVEEEGHEAKEVTQEKPKKKFRWWFMGK